MGDSSESLRKMFEIVSDGSANAQDPELVADITHRMNSTRRCCIEGVEYFKQLFTNTDLKVITKSMALLEHVVKNAGIMFHIQICKRKFLPVFVNVLKRLRNKLSVMEKMALTYSSDGWRNIEKRALQLVQLWSDTFMMEEDKYPDFQQLYRELRSESIEFPARDPNARNMIKFEGSDSPAFELAELEDNAERFRSSCDDIKMEPPQNVEEKELTEDDAPLLTFIDIEDLKTGIEYMDYMNTIATSYESLLTEESKKKYRKARAVQKKLTIIVSVRQANAQHEQDTKDLVKITDYVNIKIESFRRAAGIFKRGGDRVEVDDLLLQASLQEGTSQNDTPEGLIDLGDFLEIDSPNPIENLDRFVRKPGVQNAADVASDLPPDFLELNEGTAANNQNSTRASSYNQNKNYDELSD